MNQSMNGRKTAPEGKMTPKTYYPTMEEFKDFLGFIEKIEREDNAHLAGICKIGILKGFNFIFYLLS